MTIHLRNPRDFWSGVIFFVVGAAFATIAKGDPFGVFPGYPMGNASRMGPGYFPFVLGVILAAVGLVIILKSLATQGVGIDRFAVRGLIFVLGSVVAFGLLANYIGIFLSLIILVVVSSYGGNEFRIREVMVTALILSVCSVLIFVYGLKLPFPVCPAIPGIDQLVVCRG